MEEFADVGLAYECGSDKVVVNAGHLVDVLSDLDNTSDELELVLSPDPPYFRISTTSIMVRVMFELSNR